MPRRKSSVKQKAHLFRSVGAVDIHFHGAFGIDLMTANPEQMDRLAAQLWSQGVAAFCPTTLSSPPEILLEAVTRIGAWIAKTQKQKTYSGAIPLGIHLEGPFINPQACGAHPPGLLRPAELTELEALWQSSSKTLKILTIAPETLKPEALQAVSRWARERKIILSLGHSRATQEQASEAFRLGFTNVTHAWNALPFHQRSPGPLGAAIGHPDVFLELIIDQAHVAAQVLKWTLELHPEDRICFVSDCVPAAGLDPDGPPTAFGSLQIQLRDGACRLKDGSLAGGGVLLPEAFQRWVETESKLSGKPLEKILALRLPGLSEGPLRALKLPAPLLQKVLKTRKLKWSVTSPNARSRSSAGFEIQWKRPDSRQI